MLTEEEELYQKIKRMKRENELLMVIFEELQELVKDGYACPNCTDETSGLFYAYREYDKWRNDEQRREEKIDP